MTQAVCHRGIIFLVTIIGLVNFLIEPVLSSSGGRDEQLAGNAVDKNGYEQLTLHKRPSFFVGSRYGRSSDGTAFSSSKTRRLSVVPRNDRFFLGSRYGKRAEEGSVFEPPYSPYEQQSQQADNEAANNNLNDMTVRHTSGNKQLYGEINNMLDKPNQIQSPAMMSCLHTGFRNYYRCRNIDEINNVINQLTVAHSVEERK